MIFTILISGLIIPIEFLFGLDPLITEFLTSIGFEIAALVVVCALFGPKLASLFNFTGKVSSASSKKQVVPSDTNAASKATPELTVSNDQTMSSLRGMKLRDRVELCRTEIAKWQGLLLELNRDYDDSHSLSMGSESAEGVMTANVPECRSPPKPALYQPYLDGNGGSKYAADLDVEEIA
jgi:hypothetical protein